MTLVSMDRPAASQSQLEHFELRPLDWDTAFFGARMGAVVRVPAGTTALPAYDDLGAALGAARAAGYAHLIFRTVVDDFPAIWAAQAAGLRLVDVGVDSTLAIVRRSLAVGPSNLAVRAAAEADIPVLQAIAADAFTMSRFSVDPFFTVDEVRDFHRTWTFNLCRGLAQTVLVAESAGAVAGFIACTASDGEGRIALIATHPDFRGRGVGRTLVAAALDWFDQVNCRVVHVKTQAQNLSALALYHRSGFTVSRTELTFSIALGSTAQSQRRTIR